jgi:hypothetical protein
MRSVRSTRIVGRTDLRPKWGCDDRYRTVDPY